MREKWGINPCKFFNEYLVVDDEFLRNSLKFQKLGFLAEKEQKRFENTNKDRVIPLNILLIVTKWTMVEESFDG